MAVLPPFTFPSAPESEVFSATAKERPQIHLDTNTEVREGYRLAVPDSKLSRPAFLRSITPPDSPGAKRSSAMGDQHSKMHDSGALTPPSTPTITAAHVKTGSASSDFLSSLSALRRGESPSPQIGRLSLDDSAQPGSTELLTFPHHLTDYQIQADGEGRKRPIGVGAWSDVYLAKPSLPPPTSLSVAMPAGSGMSPPLTPVHSRGSSADKTILPSTPSLYAIKVPGSASAKQVLSAEALVLSYLSRLPSASTHIVPFYGQDTRTGALVLKAMSGTLEDWISNTLNALDAPSRAQHLAAMFPGIALSLIDSLIWMQDNASTHADIKPSNILYSPDTSTSLGLVFSDFSSSILTIHTSDSTPDPLGAGTWDFLCPSLLSTLYPASPCAATDLYSLGITLLFLVLGASPFDAFKNNKFQQREMIKSGSALQCLQYGDEGVRNVKVLKGLSKELGFDVGKWFGKVLVKSLEKRVDARVWREELVAGLAGEKARI